MKEKIIDILQKDFSYPDINKEDFQKKIYEKREFYYHKIPKIKKNSHSTKIKIRITYTMCFYKSTVQTRTLI